MKMKGVFFRLIGLGLTLTMLLTPLTASVGAAPAERPPSPDEPVSEAVPALERKEPLPPSPEPHIAPLLPEDMEGRPAAPEYFDHVVSIDMLCFHKTTDANLTGFAEAVPGETWQAAMTKLTGN